MATADFPYSLAWNENRGKDPAGVICTTSIHGHAWQSFIATDDWPYRHQFRVVRQFKGNFGY